MTTEDIPGDVEGFVRYLNTLEIGLDYQNLMHGNRTLLFKLIKKDKSSLIKALFTRFGINSYQFYPNQKQSSVHLAAKHGSLETFKLIADNLDDKEARLSEVTPDVSRLTVLHILVARNDPESVRILNHFCNNEAIKKVIEVRNAKGQTPLMIAKLNKHDQQAEILLRSGAKEGQSEVDFYQLVIDGNTKEFKEKGANKNASFWTSPSQNLVQEAVRASNLGVCKILVQDFKADPNATSNSCQFQPLFLAIQNMDIDILNLLLGLNNIKIGVRSPKNLNVLHYVLDIDIGKWYRAGKVIGANASKTEKALQMLLDKIPPDELPRLINQEDHQKSTPLHYSCKMPPGSRGPNMLLDKGAVLSLFRPNLDGWAPCQKLLVGTLKEYLDQTAMEPVENFGPMETDYQVKLHCDGLICDNAGMPELSYVMRLEELGFKDLYDHPVISSIILYKWREGARNWYWLTAGLRLFHHLLTVSYILLVFGGLTNLTYGTEVILALLYMLCWVCMILELFIKVLILVRCSESRTYLLWEHSDLVNIVFLLAAGPMVACPWPPMALRRELAGFFIVACSFNICYLLRLHFPNRKMAAMIHWTQVVSKSMLKFLGIHIFLLLGFTLGFYIQTQNDESKSDPKNPFTSILQSPFKVLAMFTGEFEFGDFPFGNNYYLTYLTFALFVFFITIVIMNLLTTVALMDITEIKNKSRDETWKFLATKCFIFELSSIQLNKIFEFTTKESCCFELGQIMSKSKTLHAFPNHKDQTKSKMVVHEPSISKSIKEIIIQRLLQEKH